MLAGYPEVLKKPKSRNEQATQTNGKAKRTKATDKQNWLASPRKIDAVIAQNDEMALGAYKAIEAAGRQKEVKIIGIDAISDALKSVAENKMSATVFQDAPGQGALAVDLAKKVVQKQPVNHLYYIPFKLVTRANLKEFLKH